MDPFRRFWERVFAYVSPYPPPALPNMRLGPQVVEQNALMIQFFTWESRHPTMSWWKHFETEVPELQKLGITQVWLPPPNKAMSKHGQGYDAYDLWDLGEFEQKGTVATRWGTKAELVRAITVAQSHGIDVLIDAVLNHKLGADKYEVFKAIRVDPNNRLRDIDPHPVEIEGWTAFNFPGRGNQHSSLKWTQEHFSGLDWDHRTRSKGIYRIVGGNHKGWSKQVDTENGNYDYLLGIDIDHRHPEVRKDLFAWGHWVLKTTGAAGFRLDAIKHMDRKFLLDFIRHVRDQSHTKDLFVVAEFWSSSVELVKTYVKAFEGLVSFFDVPLHYKFHQASKKGSEFDLRTILNESLLSWRPGDAVTFVDNHDTQPGQSLESWVGNNFKLQAYALILLGNQGHPCVFYGDLYMNKECYDERIAQSLKCLLEIRRDFAYGKQEDYRQEKNCIGFVRLGDATRNGCAVLLSNSSHSKQGKHSIRMHVGENHGGSTFCSYFDSSERVEISRDGWGEFTCAPGGVQVWVKDNNTQ